MTEPSAARHRGETVPRHRLARTFGYVVLALTLGLGLFVAYTYRSLNENLTVLDIDNQLSNRPDKAEVEGPREPINILVMGSDSREGAGNNIDGLAGGGQRSDTTILMHLSADRKHAYGVSLPRDAMVQRPDCLKKNGDVIPGGFDMWNVAFALGGEACVVQQTEQLTGVHIDHFVVVDFNGFRDMVDAVHGVEICIPEDVDDYTGNIHLKAGTREVEGKEALDYVRVRHGISQNGDIGRMKRQQVFIAAMASKVMDAETLTNPARLIGFLRAATRSLTIDKRLGSVKKIAELASEFQDIGLDHIRFITVPWDFYEPDPNRLVWAPDARELWQKMINDKPLSKRLSSEAVTAAQRPGSGATSGPTTSPSPTNTPSDEPSRSDEEIAAENGLCA